MIPTNRFAVLLALSGLMIVFSGVHSLLMAVGIAGGLLTIALAAADWVILAREDKPEVSRSAEDILSLGAENRIALNIRNRGRRRTGAIRDIYPEGFAEPDKVRSLDLAPRSEVEVVYYVTPMQRGDYEFGDTHLRLCGPLGLMIHQIKYPTRQAVKVYPNLLDIKKYEVRKDRLSQPGVRSTRIFGRGTEFESLREYLPDDEYRAVDWKATARRGKLMSRQYQQERSQNVMILLDCGRLMGPTIDGLSRLDWSINAGMMLTHVVSASGDRVGLMAFDDRISTFIPPKPGKQQAMKLLQVSYNLQSAAVDSDYYRAFLLFARRWTRRSLVVIFTEVTDPEASRPLISQIRNLAKKHLCIVVMLADPAVMGAIESAPNSAQDVYRSAAAVQVVKSRKLAAVQITGAGAIVLDVSPSQFTAALIEEYLRVKGAGRL